MTLYQWDRWIERGGYGPLLFVVVIGCPLSVIAGAVDCLRDDWWPSVREQWRKL